MQIADTLLLTAQPPELLSQLRRVYLSQAVLLADSDNRFYYVKQIAVIRI